MAQIMQNENYQLNEAVVFSNSNVERNGKIIYLPIYMLMFLEETEIEFADISIDRFKI